MPSVRRLTAILAADVAGYSRLMGADEEGTHERLKTHRRALVDPKIAEHHGRIVNTAGDGMLVEFPSVVDAVRCAVEVQRGMVERNAADPVHERIEFRVGINLGDVIVEAEEIFGDGVNIAARLEAMAQPGGICVSRVVRDQVRDKLDFTFQDMGEQSVKNIARPVRVYALRPEAVADLPAASILPAASTSQPRAAPRLSIVVLPFANLSDDREQQYFADGITEDLTTDLSRLANMFVISRNTAFSYRNKQLDAKQLGRELGVRYVLEGSVRRSGNQVRINAQLIDAETDAHLWAERFDRDTSDLFALQDEITSRIAVALHLELVGAEAAHQTECPDALDYILRGRAAYWKPPTAEKYAEAIGFFERALALDRDAVEAKSLLAVALANRALDRLSSAAAADLARAEALVSQALSASPRSLSAHYARAEVLRVQRRHEEAILEYEAAIASNRNWADALAGLGWCKFWSGSIEEAIPLHEQAIRLSPRDPNIAYWHFRIGLVNQLQSRTDEAIAWFEKARSAAPGLPFLHSCLASAYALVGEAERAGTELAEAKRLVGDARYSSTAHLKAVTYLGAPKIRALYETTFFAGLRKAGVPEE
jgi:adenylate cyclase